jgi:hypothetical protein
MATLAPAKFRIDVDIHNLLMNSGSGGPTPAEAKGTMLPEPVFAVPGTAERSWPGDPARKA